VTTNARYRVVLRGDLRVPERELVGQYCWPIGRDGRTEELLQLLCTEIDLSHAYFLQMQTIRPDEERTLPLSIPHHFVVLILGADEDPPIGFLTGSQ
jgi:hypothetical protein